MNATSKYPIILAVATLLAFPFGRANAARDYQFNGSSINEIGGSPVTLTSAPGAQITLSLQVVLSGGDGTQAVDYWLTQFSGPTAGAFSLVGRDYTGSEFADPSSPNSDALSSADTRSNSLASGPADGVPDNQLNPRNGFNLGSTVDDATDRTNGAFQVATFTLQVAGNASPGTYELRTFDYTGFGINDFTPDHQAAIFVNVVPEPATWSLLGLGSLGLFLFRKRRG